MEDLPAQTDNASWRSTSAMESGHVKMEAMRTLIHAEAIASMLEAEVSPALTANASLQNTSVMVQTITHVTMGVMRPSGGVGRTALGDGGDVRVASALEIFSNVMGQANGAVTMAAMIPQRFVVGAVRK